MGPNEDLSDLHLSKKLLASLPNILWEKCMFIGIKLVPKSQTMHFTHAPPKLGPWGSWTSVSNAANGYGIENSTNSFQWIQPEDGVWQGCMGTCFPTEIKGHSCNKEKSSGKKRSNTRLMITGIGISRICFGYWRRAYEALGWPSATLHGWHDLSV